MTLRRLILLAGFLLVTGCAPTASEAPVPAAATGPCADELYLRLKTVPLDSMTAREYEYFQSRDEACVQYQRDRASQGEAAATVERASNAYTGIILVSSLLGFVTMLLVTGS